MQPDNNSYWQPTETSAPAPEGQSVEAPPQEQVAVPSSQVTAPESVSETEDSNQALLSTISWEASEFVHREKDMIWFVGVAAVGVVLLGLSVWLQAWTFTVLIIVMVAAIFFMAVRPPRVVHYQLSGSGLQIGEQHYQYHDFRAFGVVQDEAMYYITLLPIKRFMPAIDVYFPEEHGEQIVDVLGAHVPMQTIKLDSIDNLMKRLRF